MSQTTETDPQPVQPPDPPRPRMRPTVRPDEHDSPQRHGSSRETIESVVIAFVLAFLFRTFEAEAFVIPTGSMAPTLMGRHKDVTCIECRQEFTVGATEDHGLITGGVCPNCRFINPVEVKCAGCGEKYVLYTEGAGCPKCMVQEVQEGISFKGDRILVLKALFDLPEWMPASLREPKRWDVVVFKFPEEPQVNYIKRLVGLPDEDLRIHYGDVYTRRDGDLEFQIARKSPRKQQVMRMLVFDNDHQPASRTSKNWPARWQGEAGSSWTEAADGYSFTHDSPAGAQADWHRISYHHFASIWDRSEVDSVAHKEQLITDFYAYNAGMLYGRGREPDSEPHWVGDLNLCVRVQVKEARGRLRLELVEAGERFICEFDLEKGTCRLLRQTAADGSEEELASAAGAIRKSGKYRINFANFDDRLTVSLNDRLLFGDGHDYAGAKLGDARRPTEADLRPASVAVDRASVVVSDLVLYRDIYYTHGAGASEYADFWVNSADETLSDPARWDGLKTARVSEFPRLGPDDFMMLGDNSPKSKDGRLWDRGARQWLTQIADEHGMNVDDVRRDIAAKPGGDVVDAPEYFVRRQLLIGKAFFVYWPHGVPFGPAQFDVPLGGLGTFRLPFYPHVTRMRWIR
jgi:signal peptidase I